MERSAILNLDHRGPRYMGKLDQFTRSACSDIYGFSELLPVGDYTPVSRTGREALAMNASLFILGLRTNFLNLLIPAS